jgi:hypothetical protein
MTRLRRFLGYAALVTGGASMVVFVSPIFPIGVEAFMVGGLFFGAAAWALAGPEIGRAFRGLVRTLPRATVSIDPLLPVRILKLARGHDGFLTLSEVAIELGVPLDQAQEGLRVCVQAGNAVEDFDVSRGYSLFRFPEFTAPADREPQG